MPRRTAIGFCCVVGLLLLAAQVQHLWWSTVRVENRTGQTLKDAAVVLKNGAETRRIELGPLSTGDGRFVYLPKMGETSLSLELRVPEQQDDDCRIYVEGRMYHVRATVLPGARVECEYGDTILTRKPMLFEMLF